MTSVSLNQVLWVSGWFPLATLIVLLLLIARFYEQFSSQRTYYLWYLFPLVLYGASAVRYASINQNAGDVLGDILSAIAGIVLMILSLYLFRQMMGK